MKIQVKGRNVAVTDALQDYAEEKIERVHKLLQERKIDDVSRVELELTVEKNPAIASNNVAEATIFTRGPVIRAKESSEDMYAAIDLVTDKLTRRVKKYHDKVYHHNRHKRVGVPAAAPLTGAAEEAEKQLQQAMGVVPEEHENGRVVKTKRFLLKPMTVSEAVLQLELVGHDFFVFKNSDSSRTNVVYRRNDGHYGLIEPEE
jgi:putative sigma-54 modulation protein